MTSTPSPASPGRTRLAGLALAIAVAAVAAAWLAIGRAPRQAAADGDEAAERARLEARWKELGPANETARGERERLAFEAARRHAAKDAPPTVVPDLASVLGAHRIELPGASSAQAFGAPSGAFDLLVAFGATKDLYFTAEAGAPLDADGALHARTGVRLDRWLGHAAERRRARGAATPAAGPGGPPGPVDAGVLVGGHGEADVLAFHRALDAGARAGIGRYGLATRDAKGGLGFLPLVLPVDVGLAAPPAPGGPAAAVRVNLTREGDRTVLQVGARVLEGPDDLAAVLAEERARYAGASPLGLPVTLDARAGVPYAELARALNACLVAGILDVTIAAAEPFLVVLPDPPARGPAGASKAAAAPPPDLARLREEVARLEAESAAIGQALERLRAELAGLPPGPRVAVLRPAPALADRLRIVIDEAMARELGERLVERAENRDLDSESVVDAFGVGGGAAGTYGQRFGKGSLAREGGSKATEEAIVAALRWLVRHQDADGKWDCDDFAKTCGKDGKCRGPDFRAKDGVGPGAGENRFDAGVTALSVLAFLGNGHTHRHSPERAFREAVKRGLAYLRGLQNADGSIGFDPAAGETIYNHALATAALCEAYAVSRDFTLKKPAQQAVDFCVAAQNPGLGWKYGVKPGKNDTSVTGLMVAALAAARTAELMVPQAAFDGALAWFERTTTDGGAASAPGSIGYERPGDGGAQINRRSLDHKDVYPRFEGLPAMTAVGVLGRLLAGQERDHERVRQGVRILLESLPVRHGPDRRDLNRTNFYYWYAGTYAVFLATGPASPEWRRWNEAMVTAVLGDPPGSAQRRGGEEDGSFDPVDEWSIAGGRVFATALNALTLEVYYRYERGAK